MEELFAYSVLYTVGYDICNEYQIALDNLFLLEPSNEEYLNLELMECKEAMIHLIYSLQNKTMNKQKFGYYLMQQLKQIYYKSDIEDFGKKMYELWRILPDSISEEKPFVIFCYADDCLSYGDERQCRELYEKALNYYA